MTTKVEPDVAKNRGDAVSRSLTPRYEPRLKEDLDAARPEPRPAPRNGDAPPATPKPTEPRTRPIDPGRGNPPRNGGIPTPTPRVAPIPDRYRVPGRDVKSDRTPTVPGEPRAPGSRPRTPPPTATPIPGPRDGGSGTPRVRPRVGPIGPTDVVGGGGGRDGRRGGDDPILRDRGGRDRGYGPRFQNYDYRYGNTSLAGSQRYLYGCYHWSGHYGAFWPQHCNWGWYGYPFLYCGSWSRYWYNCNSSFVIYWNSSYPSRATCTWWWPSRCYLPGSWLGFYSFSSWSSDYVDWSYAPPTAPGEEEAAPDAEAAAGDADEEGATEEDSLAELARKHLKLGDFYFRQGRYEEAAESYVRALAYAPDDGALHFVLADALCAQGDYHYAAYMIGKALTLDPGLAKAVADKRAFYDDPKVFDEQMATLRKYLEDKPYDAAAHLVLGYNLRFSERAAEAVESFERVLEIDPGNEPATSFLAALADGLPEPAAAAELGKPAERSDKD